MGSLSRGAWGANTSPPLPETSAGHQPSVKTIHGPGTNKVQRTEGQMHGVGVYTFVKIIAFDPKQVHMARNEFILGQVKAIRLKIISKPLPTPKTLLGSHENM